MMISSGTIKEMARKAGFHLAAVTSGRSLEQDGVYLQEWIQKGHAGEMHYMVRSSRKRAHPKMILPSSKSVIVCGLNYYPGSESPLETEDPAARPETLRGRISKYAVGKDYHSVIEKHMEHLEALMKARWGKDVETRWYVDYGPVLEKAFAQRAGLGFIGKNTLLITQAFGSWVFLGTLLTNLEIEPDQPATHHCGSCTLCLESCPTGALIGPFQLDSRRCISYLTIELKGRIEDQLRPEMGNWMFGCDICQDVCPYNHRPAQTTEQDFLPSRGAGATLDIRKLFSIHTQSEFKRAFDGTPLTRAKRKGLLRNAAVVLENKKGEPSRSFARSLQAQEKDELVLEHLKWAGE